MSDAQRSQTRAAYDTVAASYAEMLPDTRYEAAVDLAMVQLLIDQVGSGEGRRVLDAGCGTGRMLTHLAALDPVLRLSGADLSSGMLEQARAAHPEIDLHQADLAALPFDDEQFDGVLAWYSVIHTPPHELGAVFGEFGRVLRPGGHLLVGYQSGTGDRTLQQPYGHDVELLAYLHNTPYVEAALGTAGFRIHTRLDRRSRNDPYERHDQGFVLATRA